jgi:hypothetical protein
MKQYIIFLLCFIWIELSAQMADYYKFDFYGSKTSDIAMIYIIHPKSSNDYLMDLGKQPQSFRKIVLKNYVISLDPDRYKKLNFFIDSLLKLYAKPETDSLFNVFIISKKIKKLKPINYTIDKSNPQLKTFYLAIYNYLKNNQYPEKARAAFRYHIQYIEERILGEKFLNE